MDAANTYGTHLMAIEDRGAKKAYVYATQYKAPVGDEAKFNIGKTQLMLFEVSNSGTNIVKTPSKLCTEISSWEDLAQSQLQISADGKKLTMINHKENLGWFGAQKTEAIVFNMGSNYRLASNLIVDATTVPIGISMPHQSTDFSADSRYFYYSQQRLTAKLAFNTMGRFDLRNNTQSQNLFLDRLPQIQRSKYGMVYAYENTNRWDAYTQNSTAVSSGEPTDDLLFSYLAGGNTITNHLPYQNRIVYKVSDIAPLLFSRRVGKKNYELNDHLGNVTIVVSDLLESDAGNDYANTTHVEAFTNYYAFGMAMPNGRSVSSDSYRYGFNGMEKEDDISEGDYDFGARIYNSKLCRWLSVDPKVALYPETSPYAYALNSPMQAIDPDGEIVIFINGNHYGDGGKAEYWRQYETRKRTVYYQSGGKYDFSFGLFNSYSYEESYTVETSAFDKEVMNQFQDFKAKYYDGGIGGNAPFNTNEPTQSFERYISGYKQAQIDAADIIAGLERDESGNITETIKIVTHSLGNSYSKGYIRSFLAYLAINNIEGVKIEIEVNFAPFDPLGSMGAANPAVPTYQASHSDDDLAGNNQSQGATQVDTSSDPVQDHSIHTFGNTVKKLRSLLQNARSKQSKK